MAMLSELHPTALGHNDLRTIKQLRLVNKVLRRLASTAAQRLSVTVGGKIPPAAVEGAQLKDLNVTVEVETGPGSRSAAKQLVRCNSQAGIIVQGLRHALVTVTKVTLDVHHVPNRPARSFYTSRNHTPWPPSPQPGYADTDPADAAESDRQQDLTIGAVTGAVFKLFAPAVSKLQELSLSGWGTSPRWDPALAAFGSSCPDLATLIMVACRYTATTIHFDFGRHLPNLTTLTIQTDDWDTDDSTLGSVMDVVLSAASRCKKLAALQIDASHYVTLFCEPGSWSSIHLSLQSLRCLCSVEQSPEFDAF
ncbi:MAG: hypothetical protein WDW38_010348 [Sanguina aurantia]